MNISATRARVGIGIVCLAIAQLACATLALVVGSGGTPAEPSPGTAAATPAPSTCKNDYLPVKEGASWTYTGQFSKESYSRVFTIKTVAANSFEGRTQIMNASGNTLVDTTETWECTADGLIEPAGPLGATLQSASGSTGIKTTSASGVTIPNQIKPGDKWGQVAQLELNSGQKTTQTTLTYDFTAFATEQVTVPAGTFNAIKVQVRASTQAVLSGRTVDVTVSGFEWFVPGVGHVKSSETVYAFGIPFATEEGELQSYKLP